MPSDRKATERWLLDIHHHIAMVEGFVAGVPYDVFKDDNMRLYAAVRCLEVISEASRRLPPDLKARHPSIGWRDRLAGATAPPPEISIVTNTEMSKRASSGTRSRMGFPRCESLL
jgi:hypothetical protein